MDHLLSRPLLAGHHSLGQLRRLDRTVDLLLSTIRQGQQRRPDCGVRKNAPGNKSMLERDGTLHVRAAVVDALGDRKKLVVDGASALVVLGLAGTDQLKQKLGCDVAIADKHAVDIKRGVKEVLVVASEDLQGRALLADNRDLSVPAAHVAHAVLHRKHTGLRGDVEHGLQVVGRVGVVGVLEQDQRQAGGLVDDLVPVLGRTGLVAEAQPAV